MKNEAVEDGFTFYLKQTDKIEQAYLDKIAKSKKPDEVYDLKVGGRYFDRPSVSFKRTSDSAIHTCGKKSYPDSLEQDYSLSPYWYEHIDWSDTHLEILTTAVGNFRWDREIFTDAVLISKGLWYLYLSAQADDSLSRIDRLGREGNALRYMGVDSDAVIETLANQPEFKNLKSKYEYGEEPSSGAISISIDILDYLKPEQSPPGVYEEILRERQKENALPKKPTFASLNLNEKRFALGMKLVEIFAQEFYTCEHFELTKCRFCEAEFYPQSHTLWLNLTPPNYCDKCLSLCIRSGDNYMFFKNPVKKIEETALLGISEFLNHFGYVPASGFSRMDLIRQFHIAKLSQEELEFGLKILALIPSNTTITEIFGSWAHFLNKGGMLEISNRGKGGYRSIATDGHLCLSLGERAICEFLYREGLEHSKEPMYPGHPELNPNGLLRADFLVGDTYVEFAGRMQNEEYAKRMQNKQQLSKIKKLKWIKLEESTISELENLKKFIQVGTQTKSIKTESKANNKNA